MSEIEMTDMFVDIDGLLVINLQKKCGRCRDTLSLYSFPSSSSYYCRSCQSRYNSEYNKRDEVKAAKKKRGQTDAAKAVARAYYKRADVKEKARLKLEEKRVERVHGVGYVYLLQSPSKFYKIGHTANYKERIHTFNVKLPFEVEYIALIESNNMFKLENELHTKYDGKRGNGEWFALDNDDVEYIKSLPGNMSV